MKKVIVLMAVLLPTLSLLAEDIKQHARTAATTNADGSVTISRIGAGNQVIETTDFSSGGELQQKALVRHDHDGRALDSTTMDSRGKAKFKDVFEYDQSGKLVQTKRTKSDGTVWIRQEMQDKSDGHVVTKVIDPQGHEVSADKWDKSD
jgi:hypothetical protein